MAEFSDGINTGSLFEMERRVMFVTGEISSALLDVIPCTSVCLRYMYGYPREFRAIKALQSGPRCSYKPNNWNWFYVRSMSVGSDKEQ